MRTDILPKNQQLDFDRPPKFSYLERRLIFRLPNSNEVKKYFKTLNSSTSIVGFILQYGYFKVSGKFFYTNTFYKDDVEFICKWYKIKNESVNWSNYYRAINYRQQKIILNYFGIHPFTEMQKTKARDEATRLFRRQNRPNLVFWAVAEFLRNNHIEIPKYNSLATLILKSFRKVNEDLMTIIDTSLTPEIRQLLENLLEKDKDSYVYNLTLLKRPIETTRLNDIRANLKDYYRLKQLYIQLESIVFDLNLTHEMIDYHAQFVIRSQVFQVSRRQSRYLILICFIVYQYYFLGDLLLDILLYSTKEIENIVNRQIKSIIIENQNSTENDLTQVLNLSEKMAIRLEILTKIREDDSMKYKQRYAHYDNFINEPLLSEFIELLPQIRLLRKQGIQREPLYYKILEGYSRKLQYRTMEILKMIDFDISNHYCPIKKKPN